MQLVDLTQAALGLPGLGRLVPKAVHESLFLADLGAQLLGLATRLLAALGVPLHELGKISVAQKGFSPPKNRILFAAWSRK